MVELTSVIVELTKVFFSNFADRRCVLSCKSSGRGGVNEKQGSSKVVGIWCSDFVR